MRLAAIDIGSNSIHMVVAHIDGDGNFHIIARHKEMARLGERSLASGFLSEEAQQRGLDTLQAFRRIADGYHVADIIACATSATREARNGEAFIDRVREATRIDVRIISGIEEGRLIYLGVREIFDFGRENALVIDIGGGSVEVILADRRRALTIRSLKLGVRRLNDAYLPSDPPTQDEIDALADHVAAAVSPIVDEVQDRGFGVILATSGTARALARITAERTGTSGHTTALRNLRTTVRILASTPAADRDKIPGMNDKRRDVIVEGGVLLKTMIERFGANGYTYCDAALREGMIVDYLERNRPGLRLLDEISSPRRRSVTALARRMYPSMSHVEQVARIAVRLFDELGALHSYGQEERDLLEFAALLHNVGRMVGRSAYHKHTLYIVQHADLSGFSPEDQLMLANIARYHRRSVPKARHEAWMALDDGRKRKVEILSIFLRLANALDRGFESNVKGLHATVDDDVVRIAITTRVPADVEILATERRAHHVERAFNRRLEVTEVPDQPPLVEPS